MNVPEICTIDQNRRFAADSRDFHGKAGNPADAYSEACVRGGMFANSHYAGELFQVAFC